MFRNFQNIAHFPDISIEILRMTGEVKPQRLKQTKKYFFLLQTTEYL